MPLTELPLTPTLWFLTALVGGVLALDGVSFPQVMISRPLVSATIGGAILGSATGGILVGALLELLSMRHPPYGAAKYPDTGPAGLVAGAAYAASGAASIEALVTSLIGGWVVGWAGSYAGYARRRLNERLVANVALLADFPNKLERRVRLALAIDFARGTAVTAGFLVPITLLAAFASGIPVTGPGAAFGAAALVTAIAASIGAGARTTAPDVRAWRMVLLGALLTFATLWWRA
ncbi:MAG: PTS sugar transporter subunit IIC [Gemmatimonadota bacterium]